MAELVYIKQDTYDAMLDHIVQMAEASGGFISPQELDRVFLNYGVRPEGARQRMEVLGNLGKGDR